MDSVFPNQALHLISEAKTVLHQILERIWGTEDADTVGVEESDGVLPCPFCGGTKISLKTSDEDGIFTVRIACTKAGCRANLQSEPQPTAQRARNNAICRWNSRK